MADFCSQGGEKLLMAMAGVTIVRIGTTDNADIEGGGFVIDYMPRDGKETRRVVFAFNENGMWVEWEGNLASEP